jgi:hypothetical protein
MRAAAGLSQGVCRTRTRASNSCSILRPLSWIGGIGVHPCSDPKSALSVRWLKAAEPLEDFCAPVSCAWIKEMEKCPTANITGEQAICSARQTAPPAVGHFDRLVGYDGAVIPPRRDYFRYPLWSIPDSRFGHRA